MKLLTFLALICAMHEALTRNPVLIQNDEIHARGIKYPNELVIYKRDIRSDNNEPVVVEYPPRGYVPGDFDLTRVNFTGIFTNEPIGFKFLKGNFEEPFAVMQFKSKTGNGFYGSLILYGVYVGKCHVERSERGFYAYIGWTAKQ